MPRHQLTPEDRRKGAAATNAKPGAKRHKFTRDECAAGAYTVAAMVLFRRAKRHTLTAEDRRKGGLVTAAKRRAERAAALINGLREVMAPEHPPISAREVEVRARAAALPTGPLEIRPEVDELLDDPDPHTPGCAYAGDVNVAGCCEGYLAPDVFATDVKAMAEKLSGRVAQTAELYAHEPGSIGEIEAHNAEMDTLDAPEPDPFTLSALKRFRCGPLSPLALTRSQRAHVDIMLAGGWVEKTPEAMIRLTAKGEAALSATPNE